MTLTRFERRWILSTMEAFLPADGPGLAPRAAEVDFVSAIERMFRASSVRARLGLRLGLWMTALAPIWLTGRLSTLGGLEVPARTAILTRMLAHRVLLVRGLVTLLKLAAGFALFENADVRARSHYDRRESPTATEVFRRSLPVLAMGSAVTTVVVTPVVSTEPVAQEAP